MGRLPPPEAVTEELLRVLGSRTAAMRTNAIYAILAEHFGLTRSQRYGNPFDPKGSSWEFAVRDARRTLQEQGWLHCPAPGCWALTQAGRERAGRVHRDPSGSKANQASPASGGPP